mmetsp:Transcript_38467/g.34222  ORF Transcript_38467/g.34222 Transcript_38467/m.34222 type:complete len:126 (+) Transcript_38467:513-890(+)
MNSVSPKTLSRQGSIKTTAATLSQAKYVDKMNILVVDDDHLNIVAAKLMLTSIGHKCRSAYNGLDALKLLDEAKFDFDFVLLDINMPVMDGIQTCIQIRRKMEKKKISKNLIIVGLTGYSSEDEK